MGNFIDLRAQRFGRLVVVEQADNNNRGQVTWKCKCDCGNIKIICSASLVRGSTNSCGCLQKEDVKKRSTKHGMRKTLTYKIWAGMLQRCNNWNDPSYKDYGGRGITVCERWLKFENFFADMGEKPHGLTIDRIDNDLGYYKENCKWATQAEQVRNQRLSVKSKTGIRGVYWDKGARKYRANITAKNKKYYIGCFTDLEQAKKARTDAEQKHWGNG